MRAALLSLVVSAAALAACGQRAAAPPPPPRHTPPTTIEAQPTAPDDLVVARVDGRPVYASCVRAQVAALHVDVRAALDQCVEFELLVGAAEARGLRDDPEVADAWRREMVRTLIVRDLGAARSLDDFPAQFRDPIMARQGRVVHRPVMRASLYVRAVVPKQAPAGGPEDLAAHEVADRMYAELKDRDGVLVDDLVAAGDRAAAGTRVKVEVSAKPYLTPETDDTGFAFAVESYRKALYAIPRLGTVSPPTRTDWGWDLILWIDTRPALDMTASLFEWARQKYFRVWTDGLARAAGVKPWVDTDLLRALATAPEDAPAAAPPAEPEAP